MWIGNLTKLLSHISGCLVGKILTPTEPKNFKKLEHFSEVFEKTKAEAALALGIFHREEVPIEAVKEHMREKGIETH